MKLSGSGRREIGPTIEHELARDKFCSFVTLKQHINSRLIVNFDRS
ncbi:conserved hypothetical protein [Roseibium sp. TrichSKD4]|nr:conserved hypothetical protein [Roseibium sp. TrichSKD4]